MGKGRHNLERLLQAAYDFQRRKRVLEVSKSVADKKNAPSKVFSVIEQPLVLGALFAVGGVVGALLFTPAFILCALCILLGVHRAGALTGQSLKVQITSYLGLALLLSLGGYFLFGALNNALERLQTAFAKKVAIFIEKSSPRPTSSPPSALPPSAPLPRPTIFGGVNSIFIEPYYRFYQDPPIAFDRLNAALYLNVTNGTGKALYVRGYWVEAFLEGKWVKFSGQMSGAFEPYAYGLMDLKTNTLTRFDLSRNGFDYITQQRPLAPDENIDAWIFLKAPLNPNDGQKIRKFKVTILDSTDQQYSFVSDYPTKRGTGIVVPQQLRFMPPERIPPTLHEESYPAVMPDWMTLSAPTPE